MMVNLTIIKFNHDGETHPNGLPFFNHDGFTILTITKFNNPIKNDG
jgi:hypothetical protein